jgi:hypothetical protein
MPVSKPPIEIESVGKELSHVGESNGRALPFLREFSKYWYIGGVAINLWQEPILKFGLGFTIGLKPPFLDAFLGIWTLGFLPKAEGLKREKDLEAAYFGREDAWLEWYKKEK